MQNKWIWIEGLFPKKNPRGSFFLTKAWTRVGYSERHDKICLLVEVGEVSKVVSELTAAGWQPLSDTAPRDKMATLSTEPSKL